MLTIDGAPERVKVPGGGLLASHPRGILASWTEAPARDRAPLPATSQRERLRMRVGYQPVGHSAGRPIVRRVVFFAVVWWILLGGSASGWLLGLVAIPGAVAASSLLGPSTPLRLRPGPIMRFILSFLIESLRSGVDVARRALHPGLPLDPGFVDFPMRLRDDTSRVLLAATVTMLPGTITAKIRAGSLIIHTVDTKMPVEARVRRTERLIAALFASAPRAVDE